MSTHFGWQRLIFTPLPKVTVLATYSLLPLILLAYILSIESDLRATLTVINAILCTERCWYQLELGGCTGWSGAIKSVYMYMTIAAYDWIRFKCVFY